MYFALPFPDFRHYICSLYARRRYVRFPWICPAVLLLIFLFSASVLYKPSRSDLEGFSAPTEPLIALYLACNSDGIWGASVSARSVLDRGFSYDIGILAVREYIAEEDVAQFAAISPRAKVFWVDELSNPAQLSKADIANAKQCRYSKIHAWTLTQYERVLLLDTDTLALQNLDTILQYGFGGDLAAVKDPVGDVFNSGVMLLRPNRETARDMHFHKGRVTSYNKGDQGFFNFFFANSWVSLPFKFNVAIHSVESSYIRVGLPKSVAILHFTAESKPWNFLRSITVRKSWKNIMLRPPWMWYGLWFQAASTFAKPRNHACFDHKTLEGLAHTKNDAVFTAMISTYDRPIGELAKVVKLFDSVPEAVEIVIVSHKVGRKLDEGVIRKGTSKMLHILYQSTDSLNNRFMSQLIFRTGSVYVCDDDIAVLPDDISFAHSVWRQHRDQIVGFFPRYHRDDGTYEYNGTRKEYSMLLTKGMFLAPEYFYAYSCIAPLEDLKLVDTLTNCEDILMNFVVTGISGKSPISVRTTQPILDSGTRRGISSVGLTARIPTDNVHLTARTHCIQEFRKSFNPVDLMRSDLSFSRFTTNRVVKVPQLEV